MSSSLNLPDWVIPVSLSILALYIIGSLIFPRASVITKLAGKSKPNAKLQAETNSKSETKTLPETADQYYFLPIASLTIKATAKVVLEKTNPAAVITSAKLSELVLENTVHLQADTKELLLLKYASSPFMNDELRLTTNAQGMLENIFVSVEDRTSNIIAQISDAPKKILTSEKAAPALFGPEVVTDPTKIIQNVEYQNTFTILSEDLFKESIPFTWLINTDGTAKNALAKVDASFECRLHPPLAKYKLADSGEEEFEGVLTRPLINIKMGIHLVAQTVNVNGIDKKTYQEQAAVSYEMIVPDPSTLIRIPITRSPFVKKVNTPKFSSGLLIENYINKPSEVEGFLSIPINIGRAILSIPAQLLSFKITNLKQATALETEIQNLKKARLAAPKDPAPKDPTPKDSTPKDPVAKDPATKDPKGKDA